MLRSSKQKRFSQDRTTLMYGAKVYWVYLRARGLPEEVLAAHRRALQHILCFYGYAFRLHKFTGAWVLRYADIYDPWSENELARERGKYFWHFIHWLKRNEMIPAFTAREED